MVLHPDVQAKAQADIDRVVCQDRLPDFDDRPALPYLDVILHETLRWYPVAPIGSYIIALFFNYLMESQASRAQQRQATSTKAISSLKVCIMLVYQSANDSDC